MTASGFDRVAASYDDVAESRLGRILRARVHERVQTQLTAGMRALDLGCGTGLDALWLAAAGAQVTALDASEQMTEITASRMSNEHLTLHRDLNAADWAADLGAPFDLALANFGVLNCITHLPAFAAALAPLLATDARLFAVPMTTVAPWELAYGARRRSREALTRRIGSQPHRSPAYPGIDTRYWRPRTFARQFEPWFLAERIDALGIALPTYEHRGLIERRSRLGSTLAAADRAVARIGGATIGGDHAILELRRTPHR